VRRWLGVAVACVALVVAGCESGTDDGAPATPNGTAAQALLASATKTAEAKSSKGAFTLVLRGVAGQPAGSSTTTGEGAVDFAARQAAFVLDVPPIGELQVGRVETVSSGTTIYQKYSPQLAQAAGFGGKVWAKVDVVERSRAAGVNLSLIIQAASGDPTQALQLLSGATGGVKEVGREQVRGADTTRYQATLDVAKAAASAPPERREALQQLAQLYAQPVPAEAWIDGDGRLRKLTYSVDLTKLGLPAEARKLTGELNLTSEFFDFGTPVTVTIPPPEEVFDLVAARNRRGG
jgi:hypothetical protein